MKALLKVLLLACLLFFTHASHDQSYNSVPDAKGEDANHIWLQNMTSFILKTCRLNSTDGSGVILFTPNGDHPYYVGQWMRDSYYGISSGWKVIPDSDMALRSADWMLVHSQSGTGIMPQLVTPNGLGVYGQNGANMALDSGPFAVLMLTFFSDGDGQYVDGAGMPFFQKHAAAAAQGMRVTPIKNGMPWSDPAQPHVGYGFTDSVIKTENCFYSSVLYWMGSMDLARLFTASGDSVNAADFQERALTIRQALTATFWDDGVGMFRADTGVESNVTDIWGSALAVSCGLATSEQSMRIAQFFYMNASVVFLRGQVRELPLPFLWNKLFPPPSSPPPPPSYQDGGYWGTPLHHVLPTLARVNKKLACSILNDAVQDYQKNGANEWVLGPSEGALRQGAPSYVATIANTLKASEILKCWE